VSKPGSAVSDYNEVGIMCGTVFNRRASLCAFTVLIAFLTTSARDAALAIGRDFNVVTAQSSIAVSGSVTNATLGTAPIEQQGAGGLNTTYSGTIKTDRSAATIQFFSGSAVSANNSGSWRPLADGSDGSSPANYGARARFLGGLATVNFAGRNLVAGLVGDPTTIYGSGQFDLASTDIVFASGNLAYRGPFGNPVGTATLAGQNGTLSGSGMLSSSTQNGMTTETLTLPVNATFQFAADASTTINLTLMGQIVATSTFTPSLGGDYNSNGVVDSADYVLWRNNLGSGTSLPNDDTAGVDQDDYTRWRAQFGQTSGAAPSLSEGTPVPEPSGQLLLGWVLSIFAAWYRNRTVGRTQD
jgi:hypothetical protein